MNTTAPIIQQQELTSKCNNNCGFCYNPERCWQGTVVPRQEDAKRNLQIAELSVAKGVMAVCPTGGEPLLMGKHLLDVLSIYRQAGCYTSINTNGRLATETVVEELAAIGLNSALVSLHGVGQLHDQMVGAVGAFDETIAGMTCLHQAGIRVMPNFVATAKNIQGLIKVGELLAQMGLTAMTVTPFLPSWAAPGHEQFMMQADHYREYFQSIEAVGKMGLKIDSTLPIPPCVLMKFFPSDWEKYLRVLSPRVCMAGKSFGVVSPDGCFRSCIQAPYFEEYGGNLLDDYRGSWQKANKWAETKLLPQVCLDCSALSVCGGGCRTSCLWENHGSPQGNTMYLGQPLTVSEAVPFINRLQVALSKSQPPYEWQQQIKVRDEGWGVIVFNPQLQSFCLLSPEASAYFSRESFDFTDNHTAQVLLAVGAIKPSTKRVADVGLVPAAVKVLSANVLLPRLATGLSRADQVYQLRADTGERLFF